jgi:hypothetical protein
MPNMSNNIATSIQRPSLSIDDIIGALQHAKVVNNVLEMKINDLQVNQPKPIDLNLTSESYLVCHKVFASGKVYQPDTPLLTSENIARYERERLSRLNRNVEYIIRKLIWVPENSDVVPQHDRYDDSEHIREGDGFPDDVANSFSGNDEIRVSSSSSLRDEENGDEKRFVWNR